MTHETTANDIPLFFSNNNSADGIVTIWFGCCSDLQGMATALLARQHDTTRLVERLELNQFPGQKVDWYSTGAKNLWNALAESLKPKTLVWDGMDDLPLSLLEGFLDRCSFPLELQVIMGFEKDVLTLHLDRLSSSSQLQLNEGCRGTNDGVVGFASVQEKETRLTEIIVYASHLVADQYRSLTALCRMLYRMCCRHSIFVIQKLHIQLNVTNSLLFLDDDDDDHERSQHIDEQHVLPFWYMLGALQIQDLTIVAWIAHPFESAAIVKAMTHLLTKKQGSLQRLDLTLWSDFDHGLVEAFLAVVTTLENSSLKHLN